jgi:hypothetical protein
MTRAILIALAVSSASAAQEAPPLPLPDAPPKATPSRPAGKADKKDAKKKGDAKALPSLDAAPAVQQQKPGTMPLFDGGSAPGAGSSTPAASATSPRPPAATPAAAIAGAPRAAPAATTNSSSNAPLAPSAVAPAAPPPDLRLRTDGYNNLWTVRGFIGGERSTEGDYTDAASEYHVGAEVSRWFGGSWLARGAIDWRNSTQSYVPLNTAGGGRQVAVDENRFDVAGDIGYDFGPRLLQSGRLELTPMIGVQYMAIRNSAFPADLVGPHVAARVRYSLSTAVQLHATVGYTYNLSSASTNSALRAPVGDFSSRAGFGLPLAGGYELELDYSGDILGFQNTYRVAHGAALGFGTSF